MADKNDILTVKPQDTDGQFDLQLREAKAVADLHSLLVGGSTTVNASGVDSASASPLSANANRKAFYVQNTGTNPLTLELGAMRLELKGGVANNDGNGGFLFDIFWKGAVTVTGTSLRYHFGELV